MVQARRRLRLDSSRLVPTPNSNVAPLRFTVCLDWLRLAGWTLAWLGLVNKAQLNYGTNGRIGRQRQISKHGRAIADSGNANRLCFSIGYRKVIVVQGQEFKDFIMSLSIMLFVEFRTFSFTLLYFLFLTMNAMF